MDKRKLSAIERPVATEEQVKYAKTCECKYIVTTAYIDGEKKILQFNFFEKAELVKGNFNAKFRTFLSKEDYITQDLTVTRTKWKTGKMGNIVGWDWYGSVLVTEVIFASVQDKKRVISLVKKYLVDEETSFVWDAVAELQNMIKESILKKTHNKEKRFIDEMMKTVPALPKDFNIFLDRVVLAEKHYIFYNSKKREGHCTGCHQTIYFEPGMTNNKIKVKHNSEGFCPFCGRCIRFKSQGTSRTKMIDEAWGILVQKIDNKIITRHFDVFKDFRKDYIKPKISYHEIFRTFNTKEKIYEFEWTRYKEKYEVRWCQIKNDRIHSNPFDVHMYKNNFPEVFKGTDFRYCMLDNYLEQHQKKIKWAFFVDNYLKSYNEMRYVELIMKVGFWDIAKELFKNKQSREKVKDATNIVEILNIDKNMYNLLREYENPTFKHLKIVQESLKQGIRINKEELDTLYVQSSYWKYIKLMRYTTLHKITTYTNKITPCNQSIYRNSDSDYFDYISWLEDLDYDLNSEFNLFPKAENFKQVHDRLMEEHSKWMDVKKKDELKRAKLVIKQMKKSLEEIPIMQMKEDGLMIVVPSSADEIKREGQTLHHCVGSYVEKVAKGETLILFVRKESEPDKPYYTMEWKGRVVQCQGKANTETTNEVERFVRKFEKALEEWEQKSKKRMRKAG